MKKSIIAALIIGAPALAAHAQSAFDAYSIGRNDLRGTARFMSMGGAFTALGGDLSTLNQNPGGIGVYRSSEIGGTLDINMQSANSEIFGYSNKINQTKVCANNIGYIGSVSLSSETMPYFNWGFSYSRAASFDRHYGGSLGELGGSLTNYVADFTTYDGYKPNELISSNKDYNPYLDSSAPWMSIMMYNAYGINPPAAGSSAYQGLWDNDATYGTGWYEVQEKGHVDEYAIDLGGNIMNTVYWGIGFGITDVEYKSNTFYGESLNDARVTGFDPNGNPVGYTSGNADFDIQNVKHIYGNGFNFKAGLIIKPVNEFRIGIAVHTPTYYSLTYEGWGRMNYQYSADGYPGGKPLAGYEDTDYGYSDYFDWKCRTPWRLMVGAAGVIGGRGILSVDYEYRPMQSLNVKNADSYEITAVNDDINTYFRASNIIRVGGEFRVTPQFSLRAGYVYESSPVTQEGMNGYRTEGGHNIPVAYYTSGPDDTETQPSVTLDKSTQYITCGIGYKYKNFYADAAFVHRYNRSRYQAYTNYTELMPDADGNTYDVWAPSASIAQNNNSIVLSIGFKF